MMPYLLPWLRVNLLIRSITERVWHEEVALFRALAALAPAGMLLSGSAVLFFRRKTVCTSLQLLGAGCLMVVLPPLYRAALRLVGGRPTLIPSATREIGGATSAVPNGRRWGRLICVRAWLECCRSLAS